MIVVANNKYSNIVTVTLAGNLIHYCGKSFLQFAISLSFVIIVKMWKIMMMILFVMMIMVIMMIMILIIMVMMMMTYEACI